MNLIKQNLRVKYINWLTKMVSTKNYVNKSIIIEIRYDCYLIFINDHFKVLAYHKYTPS